MEINSSSKQEGEQAPMTLCARYMGPAGWDEFCSVSFTQHIPFLQRQVGYLKRPFCPS